MKMQRVLSLLVIGACLGVDGLAQVQNYRDIHYPTLPEFKIPKPTLFTLENGLQVFLMENHELPLIQVVARVHTGANYEPADKTGLAGLMGTVQRTGGIPGMTGDQIDDFLAARAASVETGVGEDAGFATMDCLKQDFDDVFRVYGEVLRHPAFAEDKLDLAKVGVTAQIARRNDDVGEIASRELTRLVYGTNSPLARNTEYATIGAVKRADVVAWHEKYYLPNAIILGVVGDFDSAEMRKKIEAAFGAWPKGADFVPPPVPYRKEPTPGFYLVEKSDVNQANIVFGHLGIEVSNPDYFAVQVMNEVLGGGFGSRMFSNVRSQKGLAYNVYGSLGAGYYQPGLFRAGLQTKSATATKAIDAVQAEIKGIIDNPPSVEELKRAKDSILNSFVFHYDSKRKILSQQLTYAFYGLPPDYLEQYRANIEKVSGDDVARVAKAYVHPDQLVVLIVGNSAEFGPGLTALGKMIPVDIAIPSPADSTPKVEKTGASAAAGKKTWDKVIAAMGGDGLKTITSVELHTSLSLKTGEASVALKQHTIIVFPDKVWQAMTTPMGDQTLVVSGTTGFAQAGGATQALPAASIQEQMKERARSLLYLARYAEDPELQALAAGEESVEGVACDVLVVTFKGAESRLWVAPDGKVLKQTFQGSHPVTHAPGLIENSFSDYRMEGPLLVAHQQKRRVGGQDVMTITVDSCTVNPKIDPDLFKKPGP